MPQTEITISICGVSARTSHNLVQAMYEKLEPTLLPIEKRLYAIMERE